MDASVQAALAKWPNVPACYGWLSLDRRGQWRLQGEPVRHAGLTAFMNRNYACDEQGNWFVQNGPQKVYVALEYAPSILRLNGSKLVAHTGQDVGRIVGAWLDEEGSLLLQTDLGPALLDDRDLPVMLEYIQNAPGDSADDEALLRFIAGKEGDLRFAWQGAVLPLSFLPRSEAPRHFGYVQEPKP